MNDFNSTQPEKISIDEFRRRQREKRISLGIPQINPDNYKIQPYAVDSNTTTPAPAPVQKRMPSGSFRLNGVDYIIDNGEWKAKNPDGSIMTPGQMWNHTNSLNKKKPGTVTGKPLTLR